jgi:hypothetical protein
MALLAPVTLVDVLAAAGDVVLRDVAAAQGLLEVKETSRDLLYFARQLENGNAFRTPRRLLLSTATRRARFGQLFFNYERTLPSLEPPAFLRMWRQAAAHPQRHNSRAWKEAFFVLEAAHTSNIELLVELVDAMTPEGVAFLVMNTGVRKRIGAMVTSAIVLSQGAALVDLCHRHPPLRRLLTSCALFDAVGYGAVATVQALVRHEMLPDKIDITMRGEYCVMVATPMEIALEYNSLDVAQLLQAEAPRYGTVTPYTLPKAAGNRPDVFEWAYTALGERGVHIPTGVERVCMLCARTPWALNVVHRLTGAPFRSDHLAHIMPRATLTDVLWLCDTHQIPVTMNVLRRAARHADVDIILALCARVDGAVHGDDEEDNATCATAAGKLMSRGVAVGAVTEAVRALAACGLPIGHLRANAALLGSEELLALARELRDDFGPIRPLLCAVCELGPDDSDEALERGLTRLGYGTAAVHLVLHEIVAEQ